MVKAVTQGQGQLHIQGYTFSLDFKATRNVTPLFLQGHSLEFKAGGRVTQVKRKLAVRELSLLMCYYTMEPKTFDDYFQEFENFLLMSAPKAMLSAEVRIQYEMEEYTGETKYKTPPAVLEGSRALWFQKNIQNPIIDFIIQFIRGDHMIQADIRNIMYEWWEDVD